MVSVPPTLIFVPPRSSAVVALILATASVALVPLSVKVRRVCGEPAESLIVRVPFASPAPSVTKGVVFENVNGEEPESVTVLLAAIVVAPLIAPAPVIPPELFVMPPVILAPSAWIVKPPVLIVCAAVKVFA